MMKYWTIYYLIGALFPTLAGAQSGSLNQDSIHVWMECVGEEGGARLEVWAENLSSRERAMSYELRLERQDESGNISSSVQGGSFSLRSQELKLVCTSAVNRAEKDYFMAHLRVYESARLVASAYQAEGQRLFGNLPPAAQEKVKTRQEEEASSAEVLVVDQTRTRAGREFYDLFYDAWQTPPGVGDYIIRIEELPFRGIATWIRIFIDEEQVFEYALQPQAQYVEELSRVAVATVSGAIEQRELTKKGLEQEDKSGSGLY